MREFRIHIALSALLLFTVFAGAASISGAVIDRDSGMALAGAHLRLKDNIWLTSADHSGSFRFDNIPAGEYTIVVSCVGYSSLDKKVEVSQLASVNLVIELRPAAIELPEVVVQAPSFSGAVYNRSQIRQSQAVDLGSFLVKTGETVLLDGGGAQAARITIRGAKPGQITVYLDGQQLNDPLTGEVDLKDVSLNNIEQITVRPNSDLTLGAGGAGGTIELRSSSLQGADLESGVGSFGWRRYQAGFGGGFKKHAFEFSLGQETYSGDYPYTDAEGSIQNRMNNDYRKNSLFLRWNKSPGGWQTKVSFHHHTTERGAPGSIDNPATLDRIRRRQSAAAWNLEYHGEGFTSITCLSFMDTYTGNSTYYFFAGDTIPFPAEHHTQAYNFDTKLIKTDGYGSNTAGISGRQDLVASSSLAGEEDRQDIGLFAQRTISYRRLQFAAAIRSDGYRNFGDYLSSNLSLRFEPLLGKKLSLSANLSQGTTLPTFNELFYAEDVFAAPNPELKPEKVRSWDLGAEFTSQPFRFRATFFHRTLKDMIIWQESVTSTGKKWKPVNNDEALIKGVEFWTQSKWKNWELTAAATLSDPRNKSPNYQDNFLVFQPRLITSETLTYSWKSWSFSVNHRYTSRRYTLLANTKWVDPVSLWGVSTGYSWEKSGWKAETVFSADNLTDEAYSIIRGSPMPGRNSKLSLILSRN